jgi:hypothetical protein
VYNYASTREEAIVLTMQISNTLSTLEYKSQLKSLIKYVSDTDKHTHFTALYANTFLSLINKMKEIRKKLQILLP